MKCKVIDQQDSLFPHSLDEKFGGADQYEIGRKFKQELMFH